MLELESVREIVSTLKWMLTLGASEIKQVKEDIRELIQELSKSLTNLWDLTTKITTLPEGELNKASFETLYDYFVTFYVGPENISTARTHCGNVERGVNKIRFKLAKFFHTDIGKWNEAGDKLRKIVGADFAILRQYDSCIDTLDARLRSIRDQLEAGSVDTARQSYASLKRDLETDIRELNDGRKTMDAALGHVARIVG